MAERKKDDHEPHDREPIPGEHDHTAEATTQPGIVGTTGYGSDLPETTEDPTLDEADRKRNRWEGGGRIPDRSAKETAETHTHVISGPGAADFLAAAGGEDLPGVSPNKGSTELREATHFTDPKHLVPELAPEVEPPKHERTHYLGRDDKTKEAKKD